MSYHLFSFRGFIQDYTLALDVFLLLHHHMYLPQIINCQKTNHQYIWVKKLRKTNLLHIPTYSSPAGLSSGRKVDISGQYCSNSLFIQIRHTEYLTYFHQMVKSRQVATNACALSCMNTHRITVLWWTHIFYMCGDLRGHQDHRLCNFLVVQEWQVKLGDYKDLWRWRICGKFPLSPASLCPSSGESRNLQSWNN
jgi:hypothetical protein